MNRKEILEKRNNISKEVDMLNKARKSKDSNEINKQIKKLKRQYIFYNELLKAIGGKDDN